MGNPGGQVASFATKNQRDVAKLCHCSSSLCSPPIPTPPPVPVFEPNILPHLLDKFFVWV